jgi:hypothetical protein
MESKPSITPFDIGAIASEKWLQRTCHLLKNNEWPCDRQLFFEGSRFSAHQAEQANQVLLDALLQNGAVIRVTFRNVVLGSNSKVLFEKLLDSSTPSPSSGRTKLKALRLCNVSLHADVCGEVTNGTVAAKLPKALFENMDLQELVLEDCEMTRDECQALGQMIRLSKELSSLTLCNLKLPSQSSSSSAFDEITMALQANTAKESCPEQACSSLQQLDLSRTKLHSSSLSTLCTVLQSNTALESLHLDDCGLGRKDASDLAKFLANNVHLKELSLCSNELNAESIRILVQEGLRFNSILSSLSLCQNPIGDDGAIHLTDLLCHQLNNNYDKQESLSGLKSLSVSDCEIWSRGYAYMAQGLARMHGSLQSLMVDGTEMEEHAQELLNSLRHNVTLSQLTLTQSSSVRLLGQKNSTWREIGWFLDLNRIGKRHLLRRQDAPLSIWPQVLECSTKQPDYLYYMLRHKPELVQGLIKI